MTDGAKVGVVGQGLAARSLVDAMKSAGVQPVALEVENAGQLGSGLDTVIEAGPGSYAERQEAMLRLDSLLGDDVVIATSSAAFLVADVAARARVPGRMAGFHWYESPRGRLCEVAAAPATTDESAMRLTGLAERLGATVLRS